MKDMKNVDLCSSKEKDLWIHVWASITLGCQVPKLCGNESDAKGSQITYYIIINYI